MEHDSMLELDKFSITYYQVFFNLICEELYKEGSLDRDTRTSFIHSFLNKKWSDTEMSYNQLVLWDIPTKCWVQE